MAELEQKLAVPETRQFVYLRRHLAPSVAQRILQLGVPGVLAARIPSLLSGCRGDFAPAGFYRHRRFRSGRAGKSLDAQLRGIPGSKRVIKDRLGQIVEDVESIQVPQAGQSVVLSIDRRLQYFAYRALKTAVLENKASAGAAVIADALTGEILAMVDQPAGNPNNRTELKSDLLRNRAITDVYEPGSTVKPFTIAMALESGRWTPNTGSTPRRVGSKVGRYRVRDVHNHGLIDVTHVLSKSSNVGTSKIALSRRWSACGRCTRVSASERRPAWVWWASRPACCVISANGAAKSATPTMPSDTVFRSTCCSWPKPMSCSRRMAFGGR